MRHRAIRQDSENCLGHRGFGRARLLPTRSTPDLRLDSSLPSQRLELLRSLLAFRSPVARFINHANIPPKSIKEEATHGRGGTPPIAPAGR